MWTEEARVLSLMAHGFSYTEAWHMSMRDYRRYTRLAAAWSIPSNEREDGVKRGSRGDMDEYT